MLSWQRPGVSPRLGPALTYDIEPLFPIYPQLGEHHEKTKESSEYLKYLTQQAVALQRTMNEIYKNGSNANIMPLKVTRALGTAVPPAGRVQLLLRDTGTVRRGSSCPFPGRSPCWGSGSDTVVCVDGAQGAGTAPGVRAWHTCTQPCLAADSLPGSRLLNPELLRFPHPQKCSHLLPEALFSFQGCCGWGGWAGSTDGLSYLTWSSSDWPSWAKPSCSCLPPHLAEYLA